jgi:hypothetical protein
MVDKYILAEDGRTPLPVEDARVWEEWFEHSENTRLVACDVTPNGTVSTVFLGLDQRFIGGRHPLLWETMIFGGPCDQAVDRYASYDEAVRGHAAMLLRLKQGLPF